MTAGTAAAIHRSPDGALHGQANGNEDDRDRGEPPSADFTSRWNHEPDPGGTCRLSRIVRSFARSNRRAGELPVEVIKWLGLGPLLALNSLSELPLGGPLSGVKQTPLWRARTERRWALRASGLRPRGPSGRRSRLARLRWSAAIEYGPSPLSSRTEFATLPLLAAPHKCACLPLRAVPEIARGNAWPNSFEKTRGSERPFSSPGNSPDNRQRRRGSRPFFASSRFGASLCGAPTVAPPM